MTTVLGVLGFSLLGGLTAVLAGGGIELVRMLLNRARRSAFMERGFTEMLRRTLM